MNPYDFVRIDWKHPSERRKPVWHNRLFDLNKTLYSGYMDVNVYAETPLFIFDPHCGWSNPRDSKYDPTKPAPFIQNYQKEYIIPGSSLKGLLRSVVETLSNSCLTLFDGEYIDDRNKDKWDPAKRIDYKRYVTRDFQRCDTNTHLCLACRTFGMLKERASGVFLGKVNIDDARSYPDAIYDHDPEYTTVLSKPRPHHRAFYLDEEQRIAGRKYYFHHKLDQIVTARRLSYSGRNSKPSNRYIHPLGKDTRFHFRMNFTNLESDEFGHLMQSVILEENMRHKIGYAKPLGFGTIRLDPQSLMLVDYAARYTRAGGDRGQTLRVGDEMWNFLYKSINTLPEHECLNGEMEDSPGPPQDLRRIWQWPPEEGVVYRYPSRGWFDVAENKGKRIAETRYAEVDPTR
jgi:CRISPR/Cas system CSM-associated protein Csm3 (group 7 of RAMP superfamily)